MHRPDCAAGSGRTYTSAKVDLFNQLGFVSAVLAGFAFTFVGGLLSSNSQSRAYAGVFAAAVLAAVALMVAAVGSVFTALAVSSQRAEPDLLRTLHQLVSQTFLLGIVSLVVSAGGVGWLRSRRLGYFSVAVGVLGLAGLVVLVVPFIEFG